MHNNYYLLHENKNKDNDQCTMHGICSPSPNLVYLHEIIITYVQELAFYLINLKQLGINNQQIKEDIINTCSSIITNVEYSHEQFFFILSKLYDDLEEAKKLYIHICKKNNIEINTCKTFIKVPRKLSFSEAINKGQMLFQKKFAKFSQQQLKIFEIIMNIFKSLCMHLVELRDFGIDDETFYEAFLKILNLNDFYDNFEKEAKNLLQEFAKLDHELLMQVYEAKQERYGKMVPTDVSLKTRENKAILVSGTNLHDLELLLEATKDKNIDIYTHGRMITAHSYSKFKKYPHLIGHFGENIDTYMLDFAQFPGVIFMTKHSFRNLKNLYRSRIFTTDVIAPKGVMIIKNNNFEPLIQSALSAKGFRKSIDNGTLRLNLDEDKMLKIISGVIEQIKENKIKHLITIGVSDNSQKQKDYFNKFLKLADKDCFILSYSYIASRENFLLVGSDYGQHLFFKMLDLLADKMDEFGPRMTLMLTRCEEHTLSDAIYMYSIGLKNVHMSECQPLLINPTLLEEFRKLYEFKKYTTPEADLKIILDK